jgi:hypothetical protein
VSVKKPAGRCGPLARLARAAADCTPDLTVGVSDE